MIKFVENSEVVAPDELQKYSQYIVDEFLNQMKSHPPLVVDLSFYPTWTTYQKKLKRSLSAPIYSKKKGDRFIIHFCENRLKGISKPAFQGWLEMELALCILKLHQKLYQCNFRRRVLPLFPVSGLAENFARELVEHIESGLKRYLATRMIIEFGHGLSQVYFYFFKTAPYPKEKDEYQQTIPYHWVRSLFLCRRLREFMPIFLLAHQNIDLAKDLKSKWWKYHEYLLLEDRSLLEKLAIIPDHNSKEPYPNQLVEMFKKVLPRLLIHQNQITPPSVLH